MPIRGSFSLNNASDVLSALNRYLQYKEVPANIHIDTLWKAAYEILLNMAGNRALYGSFINKLQGELTPNDIVHMVIMRAKAKMENRGHEAPIAFNYRKNIKWIWDQHNKKYDNKPVHEQNGIDIDGSFTNKQYPVEAKMILGDCLNQARIGNELGYSAFRLKELDGHDNESIQKILGKDPITIASAYFRFLCEVNICLNNNEAEYRCWLQLEASHPDLFKTKSVDSMNYKPKTMAYDILGIKQQAYSKRMARSKELIAQCLNQSRSMPA